VITPKSFINFINLGILACAFLSQTDAVEEETNTQSEEMTQDEKEFFEQLKQLEMESSCAGGSCTL
jgi:hypothetical protein